MSGKPIRITVAEFGQSVSRPVIVHSMDGALYTATVVEGGRERVLVGDDGRVLRCRSLQGMREALCGLPIASLTLRQQSAYDEMVGQPPRAHSNILEVPLAIPPQAPVDDG